MEKGIERIKWTGEGKVVSNYSIPNVKITIQADQFVYFQISEWADGTTKAEREENVFWNFQTYKPRKSILETTRLGNQKYGIKLPKRLCGPYSYYLEASIPSLKYSKKAGLALGGWCESKIIKSKWCKVIDGPDVSKSNVFSYGETIHLNLDTEGLNGHKNLIVDIYRKNGNEGELIKVYTSVDVNDGEINIAITDTFTWFGKIKEIKDVEQFYIKVKNPITKKYIPDSNDEIIHGRFLKIKKKIEPSIPKPPTNVTAFKIGEPEKYMKNGGHCNFKKIILYEDNEPVTIFDEGKFNQQVSGKDRFITVKQIHYDFDKFNIRQDAKNTIDEITKFLLDSPYLPVEIGSHTDCRGTDEYNDKLSHKRAQTIVDSLVKSGVDVGRISAKGYGKTRLLHFGENISEQLHEQNRRTTLLFKVYGNNANPINIDIIAPSYSYSPRKKIKLKIPDQQFKGCFKDDKYKHNLSKNVIENTQHSLNKITPYSGDIIEHPIFSIINSDFENHYVKYLRKFLFPKETINYGDITNDYYFYINSCAYYSDKTKPTLHIKTYPDVVWIGHFQYNYKTKADDKDDKQREPYYFHGYAVELKNGISQEIKELTESLFGKLMILIPGGWLARDVFFPYVEKQSKFYDVGLHAIYDRVLEKKDELLSLKGTEVDFIKTDNVTRYIVALVIYELVAIDIIIDLLMIYLTRGRSAQGRLAKIAREAKKVSKYLKDAGAELVPPSIAVNTGMYYKTQSDNRLALIFEANLKADPIVAVNFEEKFDLIQMLEEKKEPVAGEKPVNKKLEKNKKILAEGLKAIGIKEIKGKITVVGELACEFNVKYNLLTNTYDIKDKLGNFINNSEAKIVFKEQIIVTVIINGKYKNEFKFFGIETQVDGKFELKLNGSAALKTNFKYDKTDGLYMNKTLIFSGIKGTFTGSIKAKSTQLGDLLDYSPNEGKPINFNLIEPHDISLGTIQFFNQPKKA